MKLNKLQVNAVADVVIKKRKEIKHQEIEEQAKGLKDDPSVKKEIDSLLASAIFGFGAAAGFSLVLILFAALRDRIKAADVPDAFQGPAIGMITAGLMSLAFMGFSGLVPL